jgi:hypothetical protein
MLLLLLHCQVVAIGTDIAKCKKLLIKPTEKQSSDYCCFCMSFASLVLMLMLLHRQVVAISTDDAKCKEIDKQFQGIAAAAAAAAACPRHCCCRTARLSPSALTMPSARRLRSCTRE